MALPPRHSRSLTIASSLLAAWAFSSSRGGLARAPAAAALLFPALVPLCMGPGGGQWGRWVAGGGMTASWGWGLDTVGGAMSSLVGVVACAVVVFSYGYLYEDPHLGPFLGLLALFSLAMVGLIFGPNLLQSFVGWEGVGLLSYLLINFWSSRAWAGRAAIKAMVINKIGDVAFLVGSVYIFYSLGTFSLPGITSSILPPAPWLVCYFFVAASSKSAQFLLHLWLPDAMEGPTPVSALIHAATMVTAGVFLTVRLGHLMESIAAAVAWVGGITAFLSAALGAAQWDVKKVVAYSTCSQLGYLFLAVGLGGLEISVYHLLTHGFFKALLFLSAGYVIFLTLDEQDARRGGGASSLLPLALLAPASLALAGFPFFAGFYSKDALLELALSSSSWSCAGWLSALAAVLTSFYSCRVIAAVACSPPRGRPCPPPPSQGVWSALPVLVSLSALGGLLVSRSLSGPAGPPLDRALHWAPLLCLAAGSLAGLLAGAPTSYASPAARPLLQWSGSLFHLDHFGGSVGHALGAWGGVAGYSKLDRTFLPGAFVVAPTAACASLAASPSPLLTSPSSFVLGLFLSALIGGVVYFS